MVSFPRALALLSLVALTWPAAAQACEPTTSTADVAAGGFYVFEDKTGCVEMCVTAIWVYQEANGIEGLQRNDFAKDDTCGGQIEHDLLVL